MTEELDYYEFEDRGLTRHETQGSGVRASEKPFPDSGAVFQTTLAPGETKTYLLRLKTPNPLMVSLRILSLPGYFAFRSQYNTFLSLILGAVLALAFFNFFLFLTLKAPEYLLYVVHSTAASLYVAVQSGFATEHWNITGDTRTQFMYTGYVIALVLLIFSWVVLELRQRLPRLARALWVMVGINVAGIVLGLVFSLKATMFIQSPLILLGSLFLLVVTVAALVVRAPTAVYFALASGTFLVGATTTILLFLGRLPYDALTRNSYFYGIVVEAILMSLLLSHRIHRLRKENLEAQALVLRTEQRAKAELEQKVEERTRELDEARREAEVLARTDQLTGIANRRAFVERCAQEFDRVRRQGGPLSLVMVDLDHFKSCNDRYGHAAGDRVLVSTAEVIRSSIRTADLVGRWGGEEFTLLLPEADLDAAVALTERIRSRLDGLPVSLGTTDIRVTASFGVALVRPESDSVDTLIARADSALYLAKERGRNRVEVAEVTGAPSRKTDRR